MNATLGVTQSGGEGGEDTIPGKGVGKARFGEAGLGDEQAGLLTDFRGAVAEGEEVVGCELVGTQGAGEEVKDADVGLLNDDLVVGELLEEDGHEEGEVWADGGAELGAEVAQDVQRGQTDLEVWVEDETTEELKQRWEMGEDYARTRKGDRGLSEALDRIRTDLGEEKVGEEGGGKISVVCGVWGKGGRKGRPRNGVSSEGEATRFLEESKMQLYRRVGMKRWRKEGIVCRSGGGHKQTWPRRCVVITFQFPMSRRDSATFVGT